MFFQLTPAGYPIVLNKTPHGSELLQKLFYSWSPQFYASGTASLAAAIRSAVGLRNIKTPEVILPAYGCPDLVSAALFAGVKPVLVDLEPERPWMDLDRVAAHVNPSTVAIVAVNLFGIPERLDALRELIGPRPIVLIEDSAQLFPAETETDPWQGDLVVLSFGRGKPVTLLGGGAVLYRDPALGDLLPQAIGEANDAADTTRRFWLKASLYNLASHPRLYWVPHAMSFLHLGETCYHPLESIGPMDLGRLNQLAGNIEAYRGRDNQTRHWLADMLAELPKKYNYLIDLPDVCGLSIESRLLRYPLLVAADQRNSLLGLLNKQGLGATGMYPSPLPAITGLESLLQHQGPFPAASTLR